MKKNSNLNKNKILNKKEKKKMENGKLRKKKNSKEKENRKKVVTELDRPISRIA
jgi:hypothetical protein